MAIGDKYAVLPFIGDNQWYIHDQPGHVRHGTLILRTNVLNQMGSPWSEVWFIWTGSQWMELHGGFIFPSCHLVTELITNSVSLDAMRMIYPYVRDIPEEYLNEVYFSK